MWASLNVVADVDSCVCFLTSCDYFRCVCFFGGVIGLTCRLMPVEFQSDNCKMLLGHGGLRWFVQKFRRLFAV